MNDYSITVHKSLFEPDLLLGIPKEMFMIVLVVTVIFMYLLSVWAFIIAPILIIPVRLITKRDPQLFNIILESLFDPDFLEG